MPKQISEEELNTVLQAVAHFTEGGSIEYISRVLENTLARRTLQRRLALLVKQKRLTIEGHGPGSRYRIPVSSGEGHLTIPSPQVEGHGETYIALSPESEPIKKYVREPIQSRRPVGYNRSFIDSYRPNETFYLSTEIRQRLIDLGRSPDGQRPAGTYARKILGE